MKSRSWIEGVETFAHFVRGCKESSHFSVTNSKFFWHHSWVSHKATYLCNQCQHFKGLKDTLSLFSYKFALRQKNLALRQKNLLNVVSFIFFLPSIYPLSVVPLCDGGLTHFLVCRLVVVLHRLTPSQWGSLSWWHNRSLE